MVKGKASGAPIKPRQTAPKADNVTAFDPTKTRSPKEAKKDQANVAGVKADTRKVPPKDDNQRPRTIEDLDDLQRKALQRKHVAVYKDLDASLKKAQAAMRNFGKLAKAEGTTVDEIKLWIKLESPEGQAEFKARIEAEARIARWNGMPVGTQVGLFDSTPDRRDSAERAEADGEEAGMGGKSALIPSHFLQYQNEWLRGWHRGQDALKAILPLTKVGVEQILIQQEQEAERKDGEGGSADEKDEFDDALAGTDEDAPPTAGEDETDAESVH